MKADVICIGTELLRGEIVDANSPYLAEQLRLLGMDLLHITIVGDDLEALQDVLQRSLDCSDLVIAVGGLGPTEDDITRDAIAIVMGEKMNVDPELEGWLRAIFKRLDMDMPEENIKQAMLIPSARTISNTRGSAPGWWVKKGEKTILTLPGPPQELQRMWEKEVLPELRDHFPLETILSRTIKTWGLSEPQVDELVSPFFSSPNVTFGIYARPDGIWIRIIAKAATRDNAEQELRSAEVKILDILRDHIWGFDADSLEGIVSILLDERNLSLATLEAGYGGLLASFLSPSPQFKGGLILNLAGGGMISLPNLGHLTQHKSPSVEAALNMGEAAIPYFSADIGIGVIGTTVDAGGKKAGTVYVAVVGKGQKRMTHGTYPPYQIKERAAFAALFELHRFLRELS